MATLERDNAIRFRRGGHSKDLAHHYRIGPIVGIISTPGLSRSASRRWSSDPSVFSERSIGAGFALHLLWWVAIAALVIFLVSFFLRR